MAVYVVLVTIIFQRPTPDYPLFIFAAILPWKWFTTTLNEATLSVTGRQDADQADPVPEDRPADGGASSPGS